MFEPNALRALVAADPLVQHEREQDDELLLRSILASSRVPQRPRRRRRRTLVALVAAACIAAVVGFTVASRWVGQSALPDLLRSARVGVPLPAGVAWSDADIPLINTNVTVDASDFPRSQALIEAQCRWEQAWSNALASGDAAGAATAGDGLATIRGLWVDLYEPGALNAGGMPAVLDPVIDSARRGDTAPLTHQLALCPSWLGGTWTPQGDIAQALRHHARPALAVVLPLSSRVGNLDDEQRWNDVIARLAARGIGDEGAGFSGAGVAVAYATGDDLPALIAATRAALAGADLPAGSTLRTWDPADRELGTAPVGD